MALYNKELEKQVHALFVDLKTKSNKIASEAKTNTDATDRIMRLISSTVSAEAEGYMIDMYACMVEKIKQDDYFKNQDNLNAFYRLNLRNEINERYQFNIEDIDAYKNGIEYKEIKRLYVVAGAAAGVAGEAILLRSILKGALSKAIGIPLVVIIAGAVIAACAAFFEIPKINRKEYKKTVEKFLNELEEDILDWLVDIEVYFDERVRTLYK